MDQSSSLVGMNKAELDTPVLLIDLDAFDSNIATFVDHCSESGTNWRPHSKAHKCPEIARRQVEAGALGITCAKLSEAEVMVAGGVSDILIANQIVTTPKHQRLALLQRQARVISTVDDAEVARRMGAAAVEVGETIPLLVDVNIGMDRTGVLPGQPVLELADVVASTAGLRLEGIMGYEGHLLDVHPPLKKIEAVHASLEGLIHSKSLLLDRGLPCPIVSAGGTGTYLITAAFDGITEIQAGGGIFTDRMYRETCHVETFDYALTVLATVTSVQAGHIIIDSGFKTLSSHHQEPELLGWDDLKLRYLSAEHGVFDFEPGSERPQIGEQVELIVGYSDSTTVLHDHFIGLRDGVVEVVWEIRGRGKLT
jgi:D-serine deaminase-like pyridoxal phosphate-dependent protein